MVVGPLPLESGICVRHGGHCGAFQWPWRRLARSARLTCCCCCDGGAWKASPSSSSSSSSSPCCRPPPPPCRRLPRILLPPAQIFVYSSPAGPASSAAAAACGRWLRRRGLDRCVNLVAMLDGHVEDFDCAPASSVNIFVSGTNLRSTKSIINSAGCRVGSRPVLVLELSALVVLPQVPASNKLRFFGFKCINDHGLSDTARHRRLHAARRPPRLQATAWSS